MSIREQERRQRQRKHLLSKQEKQKRHEQRRERALQRLKWQLEAVKAGHVVVYQIPDWCLLRGFSIPTGRRVIKAGRVKVTDLSDRRQGIRSDHDQEYLDSCARDGA
jgi:hypothetical protein